MRGEVDEPVSSGFKIGLIVVAVLVVVSLAILLGTGEEGSEDTPAPSSQTATSVVEPLNPVGTTSDLTSSGTTPDAPISTVNSAPPAPTSAAGTAQMIVRDQADKGAADLDLRQVLVTLDSGTVEAQFVLRGAPTDNVTYSVFLSDDADHVYQLAWKRAAGDESAFLFDFGSNEQTRAADTQLGGRSVALIALVPDLDPASLRFYASAEGTNGRDRHSDYIPNQSGDATTPKTLQFVPTSARIGVSVQPRAGGTHTVVVVSFKPTIAAGVVGDTRYAYRARVRSAPADACVQDLDIGFGDKVRAGSTASARFDPGKSPGRHWCKGTFHGTIAFTGGFACPDHGTCHPPAESHSHWQVVGRFSFKIR